MRSRQPAARARGWDRCTQDSTDFAIFEVLSAVHGVLVVTSHGVLFQRSFMLLKIIMISPHCTLFHFHLDTFSRLYVYLSCIQPLLPMYSSASTLHFGHIQVDLTLCLALFPAHLLYSLLYLLDPPNSIHMCRTLRQLYCN